MAVDEAVMLDELGRLEINRATNIQFDNSIQQWVVKDRKRKLGSSPDQDSPAKSRSSGTYSLRDYMLSIMHGEDRQFLIS
jgi:hypothetical protein